MSLMYPCSTSLEKYLPDVSVKKIEDDPLSVMIMQMVKMLGKALNMYM